MLQKKVFFLSFECQNQLYDRLNIAWLDLTFLHTFFGFGLKWKNWIDNPNPKSNFEFGLSITIQSTKLDCNPDWAIHQSNPAIPCVWHIKFISFLAQKRGWGLIRAKTHFFPWKFLRKLVFFVGVIFLGHTNY